MKSQAQINGKIRELEGKYEKPSFRHHELKAEIDMLKWVLE